MSDSEMTGNTPPDRTTWAAAVREWFESTFDGPNDKSILTATDFAVFRDLTDTEEGALLEDVRAYRRRRHDAGYGALTLPAENGGLGLPASYAALFAEIERDFPVPQSTELISVTTGLVAPAIALYGSVDLRERFVEAFIRTDLLACQLFSEPGAGSDLASIACRAVRIDERHWRISGQKIWTSGARHADYGLLLARSNPDVPKHAGITAFLIPLDAAGVVVRPIRQMSGGSSFNEVFLDDVTIDDDLRVGDVDDGWKVATTTLAFERQASASGSRRKGGSFHDLLVLARSTGALDEPLIRSKLADLYVLSVLKDATTHRAQRASAAGASPGPAGSIGKLVSSDLLVRTGELAAEILAGRIAADYGDGTFAWTKHLLGAPGYRLAGGTDQIQRNIIAERVLKLPPEPRVDKGIPFSELARR